RDKLSRDFILTFLSRIGITFLAAITSVVLARLLGASEYGRFVFAYSIIFLTLLPAKFGLDGAAVKFVAEYTAVRDFKRLVGFINASRRYLAFSTLVGIVLILLVIGLKIVPLDDRGSLLALAALPSFALLAQLHLDGQVLNGLKQTAIASFPEGGLRAFILVLLLAIVYVAKFPLSADIALLMNGFAVLCALIFSRRWIRWYCKRYDLPRVGVAEPKRWIFTGASHLLISCSHVILSQTDLFMLGILQNSASVGLYSAALQLSSFLLFFGNAINPVVTPRMATAFSTGDRSELFRIAHLGVNLSFALTLPLFLLFLIFGDSLIVILFGREFSQSSLIFLFLLLGQLAKVVSSPIGFVFTMTERERIASFIIGLSALLNLILNLMLIPQFGAVGAACATCLSAWVWNGTLIYIVWRDYGELLLPSFTFFRRK
ncbi:MAG: oligosaccharide flippase family protein, partial [Bdellovibrionales bacterium]|nr:oligosaccharide flippase family protein [Bdellovibrionales bacterium]